MSLCGTPLSQFFGFGITKTNSPRPQHIPRNERFWVSNGDRSVCVVVCPHRVLGPHTQIKGIEDLVPSARHLWLGAGWGRARGRWAEPGLWWGGALAGPDPEQCWFQVVLPAPGGGAGWWVGAGARDQAGPWLGPPDPGLSGLHTGYMYLPQSIGTLSFSTEIGLGLKIGLVTEIGLALKIGLGSKLASLHKLASGRKLASPEKLDFRRKLASV